MGKLEAIEILHDFAREILIIVRVYKFRTFMPYLWRKNVQLLHIHVFQKFSEEKYGKFCHILAINVQQLYIFSPLFIYFSHIIFAVVLVDMFQI
jgi:hypothetical protein